MRRIGRIASLFIVAVMVALAAVPAGAAEAKAKASDPPPIFVMRGGLNIFSTGMDVLAKELTAKGYPAISGSFVDWRGEMTKMVAAYQAHPYPIVIIGHSYGADSALLMAYKLRDENIPVALLVFYDLTDSGRVPPNVAHVLNFRSSSATGINVTVTGGAHFHGTITNVTRSDLNHLNIDKAEDLHQQTIDEIASLRGGTKTAKE
jgi:pimeloyl-ACP methyl ester carboxylesterase